MAGQLEGGFDVDADGRLRGTFTHNPSSLRLSMHSPNLQQVPRGGGSKEANWVREMFVAPAGKIFYERDFSGIEARLVGYLSGSRTYTWLTGLDIHSFYTAYALNALEPGRFLTADLPEVSWPEERLRARLKEIKQLFGKERNELFKHLVHGANYLQTAKGAQRKIFQDTGKAFPLKNISRVMGVYFELFPEIKIWHKELCARVDGTRQREATGEVDPWTLGVCYARNPFGYIHRFYNVLEWTKADGKWYSSFGEDAKRLVSFLPQSTAAAIIKKAARTIWQEHPRVGQTLRLLIHDSIMGECAQEELETCLEVSRQVMESPIPELPLDPAWNMGESLMIFTEAKTGTSWGSMH